MFLADRALAWTIPLPGALVTCAHEWPLKCQVPTPGKAPGPPNTQTLDGLSAVTPVSCLGRPFFGSGHRLATDHFVPFQCSANPFCRLTAQASLAESALIAPSHPVRPLGSEAARHRPFLHRATVGRPVAGLPLPPAPPAVHAAPFPGAVTAR